MFLLQKLRQRFRLATGQRWHELPFFEATATVSVVALSFTLVAVVLLRLAGSREPLETEPAAGVVRTAELPLGEFEYVRSATGGAPTGGAAVQIMEFSASAVMTGTQPVLTETETAVQSHQYRIRDVVDHTARTASREELQDPELREMRGRMRTRINALLGRAMIDDVLFSDFRFFEVPGTSE